MRIRGIVLPAVDAKNPHILVLLGERCVLADFADKDLRLLYMTDYLCLAAFIHFEMDCLLLCPYIFSSVNIIVSFISSYTLLSRQNKDQAG